MGLVMVVFSLNLKGVMMKMECNALINLWTMEELICL